MNLNNGNNLFEQTNMYCFEFYKTVFFKNTYKRFTNIDYELGHRKC